MVTPSKDILPSVRRPSGETDAILNYQKVHVTAVTSRRDLEGSDDALDGADWDQRHVLIKDGRQAPTPPTLHSAGFELVADAKEQHCDYYDEQTVISTYYQQCEELMKRVTGASLVKAFDHNVRCESGRAAAAKMRGGNAVQGPAPIVHGDYTADSAPRRLRLLGEPPKMNDALKEKLGEEPLLDAETIEAALSGKRRYCLVNIWRPIKPVQTKPLACADAASVIGDDLVVFSIHYVDRVGENYFAKYRSDHSWTYFSSMTPDETLLIKQWDSHGDLAPRSGKPSVAAAGTSTFALHSAFADPHAPPGAPDRESIEVRLVLVF